MGAMTGVRVLSLMSAQKVDLPGGSWSRMVIAASTVGETRAALGYSVFRPHTVTASVSHEVEEVAFVVDGRGELRLEDGAAPFGPGDALFIPPNTWHAVANTGEADVVMVFAFPHPDYPPTKRR